MNYKQIELNGIPVGWERLSLSELIEIDPKRELRKGIPVKFVSMADLKEFDKKIHGFIRREFKGGSRFINADTIMARITPCLENGKTAFVDILEKQEVGSGSTEFMVLAAKENKTIPEFVYYLAISPEIRAQAIQSMTGSSGRQRVESDVFNKIIVTIPEISEQRAIAKVLSDLDEKIELNRQMNRTLESIAQAIFKQWFIDFEFPDKNGKSHKSSGGKLVDSELGEIPERWGVGKISELVQVLSGFAFKSSDFVDGGQYRLVTIKNVQDGYFEGETKDGLSALPDKMPEYCKLQNGDILLSLTGNVGRVCLVAGENYILNQRVAKLSSVNKIDYGFVYLLFRQNEILTMLGNLSSGTAQQNLSPIKTAEINIIIPNRVIMEQFGKIVDPMLKMMLGNLNQNIFLSQIRDSLLPKLMSGNIRLNKN